MHRAIKAYSSNTRPRKNKMTAQYMHWNMYVIYSLYCKEELCNKYLVPDKHLLSPETSTYGWLGKWHVKR